MPYLSTLAVCSRRGAIQIHDYLHTYPSFPKTEESPATKPVTWKLIRRSYAFRFAEIARRHFAADVRQRAYHRQTFAVAFLVSLVLMSVSRQQDVLHLLTVVRIQLSGRHHAVQHQVCTDDEAIVAGVWERATIHSFTHSFIYPFIHASFRPLIRSFSQSFTCLFTWSINQSFNHSIIHSIIHSFISPFIHSFIHSQNHSFQL